MKKKTKIPLILRQHPKKSWKMFKEGLKNLTPMDHALAKCTGHFWAVFGASAASMALLLQVPYGDQVLPTSTKAGFGIFVGAIAWLQFVEWRKEKQKIFGLEQMKSLMKKAGVT